jgi:hypothetical protein
MSLIFATQLTAVATLALATLALAAAITAGVALWKQTQEVRILLEDSKREAGERRRAQAARVFLAVPPNEGLAVWPYARNGSELPIYDARIWYVNPDGLSAPDYRGLIMPGDNATGGRAFRPEDALRRTILTFRDSGNVSWIRLPDGARHEATSSSLRESILAVTNGMPLPALPEPGPTELGGIFDEAGDQP